MKIKEYTLILANGDKHSIKAERHVWERAPSTRILTFYNGTKFLGEFFGILGYEVIDPESSKL